MLDSLPSLVAAGDDAASRACLAGRPPPGTGRAQGSPVARERLEVNVAFSQTRCRSARLPAGRLVVGSSLKPAGGGRRSPWPITVFGIDDCSAQLTWPASPQRVCRPEIGGSVYGQPLAASRAGADEGGSSRPPRGPGSCRPSAACRPSATCRPAATFGAGVPSTRHGRRARFGRRRRAVTGNHLRCRGQRHRCA